MTTLVAGVGSDFGDDRLGWRLVERLEGRLPDGMLVRSARTPAQLLDWLEGVTRLVVIDACRGLGAVGELHRYDWPAVPSQETTLAGTHDLGLIDALRLAQTLAQLPARVTLLAVTVGPPPDEHADPAAPLSAPLEAALERLTAEILANLAAPCPVT